MATNWTQAQINEKIFWEKIYLKNSNDDIYGKTFSDGWKRFAIHVLERNNLNLQDLNNKTILDVGSGPGGVAKGIYELQKSGKILNTKVIALDPLMDFYKNEIGILKEDENLKLLTNKGESIELDSNSVDIIISTNVLDHCENPDGLISEVSRILKPNGFFFPSVHLVYDYLKLLSPYIKYFDTNHPHHFTKSSLSKKLKYHFNEVKIINTYTIKYDQPNFTLKKVFKSKNFFRSLKRFLSNYVLYTCYLKCKNIN